MTDAVAQLPDALLQWRPLPPRAKTLFALSHGAVGFVFAIPLVILSLVFHVGPGWLISPLLVFVTTGLGAMIGIKRHRSTGWRLDEDGFAYRRGRMWFTETRVPASRVQHLDLRHGPLERRWKLATLVIHTAGSKMSAVSVTGLDAEDAETLRDRLARQIETDDAL
ncbi:PH domain-containing protein [Lysobacter sp. KIS68-7]|uniref:PH domain-containing protein n=1 Tax=Lysobacter sp. KIS68-7 TaxID=2904252 RepID=UPI001E2C56CE|nr:PH domain-containing protein [Lysobacter sp. KIS68-7]UHQ20303.1 PH domain-containing protein [Lysobacter sp. KIS68-7]